MTYLNKIENRIPFKIKTIKLLESTKNKINKDKNGENVPLLEITEEILVHCNIANYQQNSRVLCTFLSNK